MRPPPLPNAPPQLLAAMLRLMPFFVILREHLNEHEPLVNEPRPPAPTLPPGAKDA